MELDHDGAASDFVNNILFHSSIDDVRYEQTNCYLLVQILIVIIIETGF